MLILALDLTKKEEALSIAKKVEKHVSAIKVNYPLVLSAGLEIIEELKKIKPVIADFKIADIPFTSELIAKIAFESGADAVISHGFVGRDVIADIKEVAERYDGEVYVVTELSNEGAKEFMEEHSIEIARMAIEMGCEGLIAPATRPKKIEELRQLDDSVKIIVPGVGAQGGDVFEAIKAGADGIIVGRAIYKSENPEKSAKEFLNAMEIAKKSVERKK